jgi:hypothetical protein
VLEALLRVTKDDRGNVPTDPTLKEEYLRDDLHFGIMLCEIVYRRFLQNKYVTT